MVHKPSIFFLSSFMVLHLTLGANKTCDTEAFPKLQSCLAKKLQNDQVAKKLEEELYNDTSSLVARCFDKKQNCILDPSELEVDAFGPSGPLKDCPTCQKIGQSLKRTYFQSTNEQRQCMQQQLVEVIGDLIAPCVTKDSKSKNGTRVKVLDFSNDTFKFRDVEMKLLNLQVMIYNRLDTCSIVNISRSENTKACMSYAFSNGDMFKEHCRAISQCRTDSVPKQCKNQFSNAYNSTCHCYQQKREEWHKKAGEVHEALFNSTDSDQCSSHVSSAFGIWKQRFETALNKCVRSDKPPISLDKMIQLGCVQAQAMNEIQKRADHVMRFCHECAPDGQAKS